MNERISKGLRKHIRTELSNATGDEKKKSEIRQLRNTYRLLKQESRVRPIILEPIPVVDFAMEVKAHDINPILDCKTINDFIQSIRHQGVKDYTYIGADALENRRAIPIVDIPYKSDYMSVVERFGVLSGSIGEPGSLVRNYAFFFARTAMMDMSEKFLVRGNLSREKINR
ncbi:MAG: hypothetical protein WCV81_03450 [Microgenomates group bacterium]|jgi:hypothetical protein